MSGNSLADILAWMKDESRLLDWGLVVALERRKANLIVLQEYINRFGVGSYIPPIRGEVKIVSGKRMELIHDFVMDVPFISFVHADLNNSKAMLTMSVMGGSQLTIEKDDGSWKVEKLDEIDPLQGPKLYLDLLLHEVPGDVKSDGRVILDLSRSDNFRLTFAETETEQTIGGNFFRDLFNELKPEQRIYPLGKIERGSNALMRPESFVLRTQHYGGAVDFVDGCILALVRMEGGKDGNFPGPNYRYLIPDDQEKDYSATVLFDQQLIMVMTLLKEALKFVSDDEVELDRDGDGKLLKATFISGSLEFAAFNVTTPLVMADGSKYDVTVDIDAYELLVSQSTPLVVDLSHGKVTVLWKSATNVSTTFSIDGQDVSTYTLQYGVDMLVEYELRGAQGDIVLIQTKTDIKPIVSMPSASNENKPNGFFDEIIQLLASFVAGFYAFAIIVSKILAFFNEQIHTQHSVSSTIDEIVKLNFGQAIQGDEIHAPHNIGFFGRINPQQTTFLTTPTHPSMTQGSTQQFSTYPVVTGVQWKVENLVGDTGNPGTIDRNSGRYQAPASIENRFTRVRVTATAPGTGYHSSALVTIVANELSVHPLIQICDIGTKVELAAGVLDEGELVWSIKNAVPGESGQLLPSIEHEGHYTYHHGPVVAGKTYVLDEIEVKNPRTNATRSVHVLSLQKKPMLEVRIDRLDVQTGQVQLTATFDREVVNAVWSVRLGTGSIDSTGLYRAAPTSKQRFALIFADFSLPPFKFEGHLILPLPLVEFPARLKG